MRASLRAEPVLCVTVTRADRPDSPAVRRFAGEFDTDERMAHVSQGRPPSGYFCTETRRGDRHSTGYMRDYMRERRRKASQAADE